MSEDEDFLEPLDQPLLEESEENQPEPPENPVLPSPSNSSKPPPKKRQKILSNLRSSMYLPFFELHDAKTCSYRCVLQPDVLLKGRGCMHKVIIFLIVILLILIFYF